MIELPRLDCHAHIASDVTPPQVSALGDAVVFAVTRSLGESATVADRTDGNLLWGCGVHPANRGAREDFDAERFRALVSRFALVGEIGLDRRSGDLKRQSEILRTVLKVTQDQPVLLSLHSTGCVTELLDLISEFPGRGMILHWFLGDHRALNMAVNLGCYFSVNAAMPEELLTSIPLDRLLPETDYPASQGRTGAQMPGDTARLEEILARLTSRPSLEVRLQLYRNLRQLALDSGAIDRFPARLADLLLPL